MKQRKVIEGLSSGISIGINVLQQLENVKNR